MKEKNTKKKMQKKKIWFENVRNFSENWIYGGTCPNKSHESMNGTMVFIGYGFVLDMCCIISLETCEQKKKINIVCTSYFTKKKNEKSIKKYSML